ncbi:hypothetical protein ABPG72_010623 [Tetrahymena utriculariae]
MDNQGFDSELRTYYNDVKAQIKNEHSEYIQKHPELREILNDFLSTVMLEKPQDVYEYAQQYFSYFNIEKDKILLRPIIISGPSGAGKGTLVNMIVQQHNDKFQKSISYTSRKPQRGETHGVEYYFVSREEFEKEIAKNSFLEFCVYQGEYYGTHKGKLESIIQSCKIAILEIDVQGAKKVHKEHPEWNFIFLNATNLEELEKRMKAKGSQLTEQQIDERLKIAIKEIDESKKLGFYQNLVNDDLEECVEQFIKLTKAKYNNIKW